MIMLADLKNILIKEAEQSGDVEKIKSIKSKFSLEGLGYTFKEAVQKLKEAGVPILITEEEKEKRNELIKILRKDDDFNTGLEGLLESLRPSDIESLRPSDIFGSINDKIIESSEDIVMVHKTDYAPKGDRIESRESGGVTMKSQITLGGKEYEFSHQTGRDTVHFSANHEVLSNDGGDWDEKRYIVIIPFNDLKNNSDIVSGKPEDTYTRGSVKLTENSYILCPKGESLQIQKENPNVTVIEYEGEYALGYGNVLLSLLGYTPQRFNSRGKNGYEQSKKYREIVHDQEKIPYAQHAYSEYKKSEEKLNKVYTMTSLMKLIGDEKLIEKLGKDKLIEDLMSAGAHSLINVGNLKDFISQLKKEGFDFNFEEYKADFEKLSSQDNFDYEKFFISYMLYTVVKSQKESTAEQNVSNGDNKSTKPSSEANEAGKQL